MIVANDLLKPVQVVALDNPTALNVQKEREAQENWLLLRLAEESFFWQRSHIRWLEEGDFNTRFFHKVMQARHASNAIKYLLKRDRSRKVLYRKSMVWPRITTQIS